MRLRVLTAANKEGNVGGVFWALSDYIHCEQRRHPRRQLERVLAPIAPQVRRWAPASTFGVCHRCDYVAAAMKNRAQFNLIDSPERSGATEPVSKAPLARATPSFWTTLAATKARTLDVFLRHFWRRMLWASGRPMTR